MSGYIFAAVFGVLTVVMMVLFLRNRYLRDKYAGTWILIAVGVLVIALFPAILDWLADLLGVHTPVNIVFFVGALALLLISVQFSVELSRTEERVRRLAEEVSILRSVVERGSPQRGDPRSPGRPGGAARPGGSDPPGHLPGGSGDRPNGGDGVPGERWDPAPG